MRAEAAAMTEVTSRGRGIASSAVWHLVGQIVPLVVAVLTIPVLVGGLGSDRFGVLSLAWVVIGYFALVDLGLGRAMTQALATRIGTDTEEELPAIFWSTFAIMLGLGVVAAAIGAACAPWIADRALSIPDNLRTETRLVFLLLALTLPVDMTMSALRGAMEAGNRFDLTSMSRIATGLNTYLAPIAVMAFTDNLVVVVAVLVLGRLAAWVVSFALCLRMFPAIKSRPIFRRAVVVPLLRTGGWMNVFSMIFPLMMTLDRFLIGSLVSVTAVTYYATPYEMVTKIWILPVALSGVLFPAFSSRFVTDLRATSRLYASSVRVVFLAVVPVVLVVVTFAREGLVLWLGDEFASNSGRVLQILAIGVCVNSLSNIPFALTQGAGRSDLAAKLQLIELPIYVPIVVLAARWFGIEGVAVVWTVRGVLNTAAIFVIAGRLLGRTESPLRAWVLALVSGLLALGFALFPADLPAKVAYMPIALGIFAWVGWTNVLAVEDRLVVKGYADALRARIAPGRLAARSQDAV